MIFSKLRDKKYTKYIVTAAIGLVLATGATVYAITTSNAHTRGVVVFAGDSNILMSSGQITLVANSLEHESNGYTPVFVPKSGAGIRTRDCLESLGCPTTDFWGIKLGEIFTKVDPDAIVVNLGVNDTKSPGEEDTVGYYKYGKKIDWFMSKLPADTPVFWTTLPCTIIEQPRLEGCQNVNIQLALAPARWPNLTVLKWQVAANSHPEYIGTDGVHYTPVGQKAYANFVTSALDAKLAIPEN